MPAAVGWIGRAASLSNFRTHVQSSPPKAALTRMIASPKLQHLRAFFTSGASHFGSDMPHASDYKISGTTAGRHGDEAYPSASALVVWAQDKMARGKGHARNAAAHAIHYGIELRGQGILR